MNILNFKRTRLRADILVEVIRRENLLQNYYNDQ